MTTSRPEGPTTPFLATGWIDRSRRERVAIGGPDRARFLHNLTTNNVKRLAVGSGQESFVTSPQGKTLGYVTVLATADALLVGTDPGGLSGALPHLRKYGIFDDVAIDDVAAATFEFHLLAPDPDGLLARLGGVPPAAGRLSHRETTAAGLPVRALRADPAGRFGLTILGARADAAAMAEALERAGLGAIDPEAFEALRIAAGTPVFGRDVTAENLPQEVGRDALAIDFVKGCYLGQETVARLDALGHVNKRLVGLRFAQGGVVPPPGTPLEADGKRVGTVTSSADTVALAYLKVAQAKAGTEVFAAVEGGPPVRAVVVDLAGETPS